LVDAEKKIIASRSLMTVGIILSLLAVGAGRSVLGLILSAAGIGLIIFILWPNDEKIQLRSRIKQLDQEISEQKEIVHS